MNSGDALHCSHVTWTVENAEDEREREGKGEGEEEEEEEWLTVEMAEAGGELLSTVHMQREQWRMQKTKKKGKGKGKTKRSGDGRGRWWIEGATLHCALFIALFMFFFFRASVYCVYKHSLQLSTKSSLKLLLVVLRFNRRWSWVSQTVMCI